MNAAKLGFLLFSYIPEDNLQKFNKSIVNKTNTWNYYFVIDRFY